MRIRIVFHLWNKGACVPFHHQHLMAQVIKGVNLRGGNSSFRNFTDYNFSGLKGQTKVSRRGLHFYSNKVTLVFSCNRIDFVDYFLDSLFDLEEFEVGGLQLSPETVEKEEPVVVEDKMKYVCISPIVVRKPLFDDPKNRLFIYPEDDLFSDLLYDSTMERMESQGIFKSSQIDSFFRFQIVPDKAYLSKLSELNKKFARVYPVYDNDIKFDVRGYTFPFTLYANKQVQEFIFTQGIGSFCHKGFGMIDIANSDPIKRIITRKSKVLA